MMDQVDVMQGLKFLAEKLGATREKVYDVLLSQARVEAVKGIIQIIACSAVIAFCMVWLYKIFLRPGRETKAVSLFEKVCGDDRDTMMTFLMIVGFLLVVFSILCVVSLLSTAPKTIDVILNPEYWAMERILRTVAG